MVLWRVRATHQKATRRLMQEEMYDRMVGDPKYEADDPREVERERAERDEWLALLARQLEAAGR